MHCALLSWPPVGTRTDAQVTVSSGNIWNMTKGAPQVILGLCHLPFAICHLPTTVLQDTQAHIQALAQKGYRTLGAARMFASGDWQL